MKHLLLKVSFCISIFFCASSKAQSYVPFPDSNAVWNIFDDWGADVNYIFTINGDSLYNGHVYKKYYISNDTTGTTAPALARLVRQDIPNKKNFAIYPGNSTEQLIYKFGLNINDTITVYTSRFGWGPVNLKVFAKDSILINGQYRKRLQLNSKYSFSGYSGFDDWVEGIGSMFGIFNAGFISMTTDIEFHKSLVCFTKNGAKEFSIYGSSSSSCFVHLRSGVGIEKHNLQNSLFKIYPNPSSGILNIEVNAVLENPLSISIRDALGRTVKQVSISVSTKIDVSDVENGIYFIILSNEQKQIMYQSKIVKQN